MMFLEASSKALVTGFEGLSECDRYGGVSDELTNGEARQDKNHSCRRDGAIAENLAWHRAQNSSKEGDNDRHRDPFSQGMGQQ